MSINFHRLMAPIDINRLIFIEYIDYIDCFPMIDFHRLDPSGFTVLLSSGKILTLSMSSGALKNQPKQKW